MQPVAFQVKRLHAPNAKVAQRTTVRLVAKAIRDGSSYLPIRNHAAAVATRARPKDYLGQVKAIYDDFIKRWRYVKDTFGVETLAASPRALWHLVIAGDGRGVGEGLGAGDCDDAAAAVGAELAAIGMPVRIATARNPDSSRNLFSHIFVQAHVPGQGWISVDPVGHPFHGFAWTPPYNAIAVWDLDGHQIAGDDLLGGTTDTEDDMACYHGFGEVGRSTDYQWEEYDHPGVDGDPLPWDVYGLADFGAYVDSMGYVGHGGGYMVEVDEDNEIGDTGLVRTPMLELQPGPFALFQKHGIVMDGTLALGDDGSVYEYDGFSGFFKKLIKRAKKFAKKVGKKVLKGAEKMLKKTKFGRKIIKLKNKLVRVALKIVKPLLKIVGKWAPKLAPIAAMIPGFGTVVAGYLTAAGKAAKLADKHGVEFVEMTVTDKKGKKKKVRKMAGKPRDILAYKKALKKAAKHAKKNVSKKDMKKAAAKMKAYKGKRLPRESLIGKKVLKLGSPEWVASMQTIGLRRGKFDPNAEPKRRKKSRVKKRRAKSAPAAGRARVVGRSVRRPDQIQELAKRFAAKRAA